MRMIDADKLILSLNDNYLANIPTGNETLTVRDYRESICEGLKIAMATVEGSPTVGKWISVQEQLPQTSGTYLCYQPWAADICQLNTFRFSSVKNDWIGKEVGSRITGISHWMPLPEPPKEESDV